MQPAEIARSMARTMDHQQSLSVDAVYVPNVFQVRLHPEDLAALAAVRRTVERDTKEYGVQVAQKRGYKFAGPLKVELVADESLDAGDFVVEASFREALHGGEIERDDAYVDGASVAAFDPLGHTRIAPSISSDESERSRSVATSDPAVEADTQTYRVHIASDASDVADRLLKVVEGPDRGLQILLDASRSSTVGRTAQCDLALTDTRVSKVHAALEYDDGGWWIKDLKSTNGTYKNGLRVERSSLTDDDEVTVGLTTIRFSKTRLDG